MHSSGFRVKYSVVKGLFFGLALVFAVGENCLMFFKLWGGK